MCFTGYDSSRLHFLSMTTPQKTASAPIVDAAVREAVAGLNDVEVFGIYIHVPFCVSRCGYCDFNTYVLSASADADPIGQWLQAIMHEIDRVAALHGDWPISTVFFGGGTPSLAGSDVLNKALGYVAEKFSLAPDAEVTCEVNPESASEEFFRQLRAGGFTRVSLGMQSLKPHVLKVLEREHCPTTALDAIGEASRAGFEHISVDLMYGTPGESPEDLAATVAVVAETAVDHISAYSLIVEPGTALNRKVTSGQITETSEDELADRYEQLTQQLAKQGFQWYEVSNFARDSSARCRHNEGYWQGGHWWGIGPGAHSSVGNLRWWNHKLPRTYNQACSDGQLPVDGYEMLDEHSLHVERVMVGMRCRGGMALAEFSPAERHRIDGLVGQQLTVSNARVAVHHDYRYTADGIVRYILD